MLQLIAKWHGDSASDGEYQKIVKTLRACKTNVMKYADDQLPTGELQDLEKDMANSPADFHDKIHAHSEDEITKLTQLDIPESEALELVSE